MMVPKDMHKLVIKYKDHTSISKGKKSVPARNPRIKILQTNKGS